MFVFTVSEGTLFIRYSKSVGEFPAYALLTVPFANLTTSCNWKQDSRAREQTSSGPARSLLAVHPTKLEAFLALVSFRFSPLDIDGGQGPQ